MTHAARHRLAATVLAGALALGAWGLVACSPVLDGGGLLQTAQVGRATLSYPAGLELHEEPAQERYLRASATLESPDGRLAILVREYGGLTLEDLRQAAEGSTDPNLGLALERTTVGGRDALRLEGRRGGDHVAFCYVDGGEGTVVVVGTECDQATWEANEAAIEAVLSHVEVR